MDKIKQQANTVSQLVFSAETGETYKKALGLTWDIVRETGILIWLVICLVFVAASGSIVTLFSWDVILASGTRAWVKMQPTAKPSLRLPQGKH